MKRNYEQVPDPLQVYRNLTGEEEVGVEWLDLEQIILSDDTQPRAEINWEKVAEYAERMDAGDEFPAVVVFHEAGSGRYWLADGFHRVHATRRREKPENRQQVRARVIAGTLRDAILYSASANGTHGMPRTNEDKRRAVLRLLNDPEWSQWSNREIARRCKVSEGTVRKYREELSAQITQIEVQGGMEGLSRKEKLELHLAKSVDFVRDSIQSAVYKGHLTADDLDEMAELEKRGRKREWLVDWLRRTAIKTRLHITEAEAEARLRRAEAEEQGTRKVERGGTVYEQRVSSEKRSQAAQRRARQRASSSRRGPQYVWDPDVSQVPPQDEQASAGGEIRLLRVFDIEDPIAADHLNNYLREFLAKNSGVLVVRVFWKPPRG